MLMASIDCSNPKNANERSLCACSESVKTYKRLVDQFDIDKANYASDMASYNRWKNLHNEWAGKSGKYSKWKDIISSKDHSFSDNAGIYNDCGDINNTSKTNNKCSQKASERNMYDSSGFYSYENYKTSGTGPCHWVGVRCKRTESSKQKIDNDYNADRPQSDPEDSSKVWLNRSPPIDSSDAPSYSGVCCSQIINRITNSGGDVNISNISQECGTTAGSTSSNQKKEEEDIYAMLGLSSLSSSISSFFMIILLVYIIWF